MEGFVYRIDETQYTEKDLERIMNEENVVDGTKQNILIKFKSDKSGAIDELRKLQRHLDAAEARRKFTEAKNYFLLNEIYISELVGSKIKEIIANLANLCGILMAKLEDPTYHRDTTPIKENSAKLFDELRTLLRNELSQG